MSQAPLLSESLKAIQKRQTHQCLLEKGCDLLRTGGVESVSVAKLMQTANLTVGGFYAHFKNKKEMLAALLEHALVQARERMNERLAGLRGRERVREYLSTYMSASHRDSKTRCPIPAVLSSIERSGPHFKRVLTSQLEISVEQLQDHLVPHKGLSTRQQALAVIALSWGGLSVARAVKGSAVSDEILEACQLLGKLLT